MTEKYCCVIDAAGRYVTFVLALDDQVQHYALKDGESLIDAKPPARKQYAGYDGCVDPVWDADTATWAEGATAAEMSAWEALHPEEERPPAPGLTTEERIAALEEQLAETDEAAIELYEASLAQEAINAAQDEAIIEIYETMEGIING